MDADDISQIIFLLILLALSAFFSSSETALTTVNKIRMRTLAEAGNTKAKKVLKVTENSPKMLSAILIGNNIVNLSASSLTTSLAIKLFGSVGAGVATGILTFLILIFGEVSPKTLATIKADKISLSIAGFISVLMVVLTPVIFIINKLSLGVIFLFGIRQSGELMFKVGDIYNHADMLRAAQDVYDRYGQEIDAKLINKGDDRLYTMPVL